jgi:hypothetical protein
MAALGPDPVSVTLSPFAGLTCITDRAQCMWRATGIKLEMTIAAVS